MWKDDNEKRSGLCLGSVTIIIQEGRPPNVESDATYKRIYEVYITYILIVPGRSLCYLLPWLLNLWMLNFDDLK
jgi:hypothetical protein